MPYIKNEDRDKFVNKDVLMAGALANNAGELNYVISMVCKGYLVQHGREYRVFNDIIGVLEAAKMEIYRRQLAPYEDIKIEKNGDL